MVKNGVTNWLCYYEKGVKSKKRVDALERLITKRRQGGKYTKKQVVLGMLRDLENWDDDFSADYTNCHTKRLTNAGARDYLIDLNQCVSSDELRKNNIYTILENAGDIMINYPSAGRPYLEFFEISLADEHNKTKAKSIRSDIAYVFTDLIENNLKEATKFFCSIILFIPASKC